MDTNKIAELERRKNDAGKKLQGALEQKWPKGSAVAVMLSAVQKVPSAGVVVGCYDGALRVRLIKPNPRGYHTVKSVYWRNVCA